MWLVFKQELQDRILRFIPNFHNTWKQQGWKRPLSLKLRELILKKNRLWTRYIETRDKKNLKNINRSATKLEMKPVN